jgi:tRNA(Arg) A34 adenosine deaminase TadA
LINNNTNMERAFMEEAIRLSKEGMDNNEGGPFGCVIVKDGKIIGRGYNRVTSTQDPTAHAEIVAIRDACRHLNHFQLDGCEIYTSCEPCPMCLGAIYWARPSRIYFACSRSDAAAAGFDDSFIYDEIGKTIETRRIPMEQYMQPEGNAIFRAWIAKPDKTVY